MKSKIFKELTSYLKDCNIKFSNLSDDGRINSAIDESVIISLVENFVKTNVLLVENNFECIVPKIRNWYDFALKNDKYFLPVNIKVTNLQSDNLNCKLGLFYALSGVLPEDVKISNEIDWDTFLNLLNENLNKKTDKDYYFLVFNKKDNSDIFSTSLKSLSSLVPNGNNLPFQANWENNKVRVKRSHTEAVEFILNNLKESIYKRASIKDSFDKLFGGGV